MTEKTNNAKESAHSHNINYTSRVTAVLQQDETKRQIRYISKIFLILGIIIGIKYIVLSLYGTNQIEAGGSTIAVQTNLFVLFACGILATGACFVSAQTASNIQSAVAGSAVGTYFGTICIMLAIVFAEQVVGSDFASSIAASNIQGLLKYLVIYSGGISLVGGVTGYVGFSYNLTSSKDRKEHYTVDNSNNPTEKTANESKTVRDRISIIIDNNISTLKTTVYLYGAVGLGYSASAILLGIFFSGFKLYAIYVILIASYGIIFCSPMLSAYFGHKIGRNHTGASGIVTGAIGTGVGFILMVLIMTVFGSLGISQNPITLLSNIVGGLSSNPIEAVTSVAGQTPELTSAILSVIPKGHEVSNIILVGAFGNAVAGAIAAKLTRERI